MPVMSKLTAAYMAGLIDGEGCLEVQKRINKDKKQHDGKNYCPRIRIAMCNYSIIMWLKDSFGGWINERKGNGNNNNSWCWTIKGVKSVKPFLEAVYPYLKVKKENAVNLREFFKTFNNKSYNIEKIKTYHNGEFHYKVLKNEVLGKREKCYLRSRELNKRGVLAA